MIFLDLLSYKNINIHPRLDLKRFGQPPLIHSLRAARTVSKKLPTPSSQTVFNDTLVIFSNKLEEREVAGTIDYKIIQDLVNLKGY